MKSDPLTGEQVFKHSNTAQECPCGQRVKGERLTYQACCKIYHQGAFVPTPEVLMRSRYSAFVMRLHDYLIATHHPDTLNGLTKSILDSDNQTQWLGLSIQRSATTDDNGVVEFHAWYRENNRLDAIHEVSQFIKQHGVWWYTSGEQLNPQLPKRNDPCICYSGRKFKQCCLNLAN
ncbi:YchJ family protein [Shewanella algidipiscicola]|uniref:UPF0225 protein n=1 Tax=Shewanella algidipiscicola TaxID=614070 RepID=A0ABQ4NSW2_9GAMM|nr:YchJ family metal-binding protein [Shewanella algidipiscicola]GIU02364.1 UPF0225 protein [Shewanella algidipiscicola]